MYLIVGLGNPGAEYAHTRHNVGFDVLEALAASLGATTARKKDQALVRECFFNGQKIVLAMPQTYMNLSGEAVAALVRWYHIEPENLMVIYDDIDLPQGAIRMRKNGSAGTHNGMRSIIGLLGYENFPRLRVGTGGCPPDWDLKDWVLSRYQTEEERAAAKAAFSQAVEAVREYIQNGIESAMSMYNTKKQKKPKDTEKAGDADEGGNA